MWSLSNAFTSAFKELDPIRNTKPKPSWLDFCNRLEGPSALSADLFAQQGVTGKESALLRLLNADSRIFWRVRKGF